MFAFPELLAADALSIGALLLGVMSTAISATAGYVVVHRKAQSDERISKRTTEVEVATKTLVSTIEQQRIDLDRARERIAALEQHVDTVDHEVEVARTRIRELEAQLDQARRMT